MISIVTINKNNLDGLKRTADSVVNQKDKNFKWFVFDGNSKDGSIEFIRNIIFSDLEIFIQEDKGIYDAMNRSISQVHSGDLIWFLNSGDSLYDNYVVGEINALNFNGDILYGDFVVTDYKSEKVKSIEIRSPEELNVLWLLKKTLNHQSYLVRGVHLKKNIFNLEYKVCADWVQLFTIIWGAQEMEIKKIERCLVSYEAGGYSNKHEAQRLIERNKFLESIFAKSALSDLNSIASLVSKKNFFALLGISRSKYRWRILSLIIRLLR